MTLSSTAKITFEKKFRASDSRNLLMVDRVFAGDGSSNACRRCRSRSSKAAGRMSNEVSYGAPDKLYGRSSKTRTRLKQGLGHTSQWW